MLTYASDQITTNPHWGVKVLGTTCLLGPISVANLKAHSGNDTLDAAESSDSNLQVLNTQTQPVSLATPNESDEKAERITIDMTEVKPHVPIGLEKPEVRKAKDPADITRRDSSENMKQISSSPQLVLSPEPVSFSTPAPVCVTPESDSTLASFNPKDNTTGSNETGNLQTNDNVLEPTTANISSREQTITGADISETIGSQSREYSGEPSSPQLSPPSYKEHDSPAPAEENRQDMNNKDISAPEDTESSSFKFSVTTQTVNSTSASTRRRWLNKDESHLSPRDAASQEPPESSLTSSTVTISRTQFSTTFSGSADGTTIQWSQTRQESMGGSQPMETTRRRFTRRIVRSATADTPSVDYTTGTQSYGERGPSTEDDKSAEASSSYRVTSSTKIRITTSSSGNEPFQLNIVDDAEQRRDPVL